MDVLVVDDNLANLKLLRVALEVEGHESRTAVDAQAALAALAERRPDIILMDIQMPGVDGLDLTRRLKADPATADIVVLAVTSYAMTGDREKALEAGCDGYITKPIDVLALSSILEGHLAAHRPREAVPPPAKPQR